MSGLKPAGRAIVMETFAGLRERELGYEEGEEWLAEWTPSRGAFGLTNRRLRRFETCLRSELHRLPETPRTKRFRAALHKDARIAPLIGQLVGTPTNATLLEEDSFERSLTWHVARACEGFGFDPEAFDRAYGEWLAEYTAKTRRVRFLAMLHPFTFGGCLDLGHGILIDQLTDDEVSGCLKMGAIESVFAGTGRAMILSRTAVRIEWNEPHGLYDEFVDDDRAVAFKSETDARETAERVVEALRVYQPGGVAVHGTLTVRGDGSLQGGPVKAARPRGTTMSLDARQARRFADFWPSYLNAGKQKAVGFALRRFAFAGERSRSDDAIVDLVAALEGLLLSDNPRAGEFQFRTSVRGAQFTKHRGYSRQQVYGQLKRAYTVRSQVAHGKTPTKTDLRGANGEPLDLDAFVAEIESLARATMKDAVDRIASGNGWPPDWDRLMLGRVSLD